MLNGVKFLGHILCKYVVTNTHKHKPNGNLCHTSQYNRMNLFHISDVTFSCLTLNFNLPVNEMSFSPTKTWHHIHGMTLFLLYRYPQLSSITKDVPGSDGPGNNENPERNLHQPTNSTRYLPYMGFKLATQKVSFWYPGNNNVGTSLLLDHHSPMDREMSG